jgi:dTDP-glucose 4,6-dehydratase
LNVLVTGGSGFIGSHFIETLLASDFHGVVVNLDALTYAGCVKNTVAFCHDPRYVFVHASICDADKVTEVIEQYAIEVAVHFAAETHVDNSIVSGEAFVRTNVEGTLILMTCLKRYWLKATGGFSSQNRMILISTDEVYGQALGDLSFSEDAPLAPRNPYAASKASGDLLALSFLNTYGFPVIITRCCNNYGPRQHVEKFIPQMILKAQRNEALPLYGDGLHIREWIHVKDHCQGLMAVLEQGQVGEVYNLGSGYELTNLEVCQRILHHLHKPIELITPVKDRPGHDRRYALNSEKARTQLGWTCTVNFDTAIQEMLYE